MKLVSFTKNANDQVLCYEDKEINHKNKESNNQPVRPCNEKASDGAVELT